MQATSMEMNNGCSGSDGLWPHAINVRSMITTQSRSSEHATIFVSVI
jgi:hypothetical protein